MSRYQNCVSVFLSDEQLAAFKKAAGKTRLATFLRDHLIASLDLPANPKSNAVLLAEYRARKAAEREAEKAADEAKFQVAAAALYEHA